MATGHYIESNTIHPYQKNKWLNTDTLEVNVDLIVNYELERFILSYTDSVKIINSKWLIDKIKERMERGVK